MKFVKMHGTGNDYVYVDLFKEKLADPAKAAIAVSHRRFGVGGDGLILIKPRPDADGEMEMYNADGSVSEMCGNGLRCVALHLARRREVDALLFSVETDAGVRRSFVDGTEVTTLVNVTGTVTRWCRYSKGGTAATLTPSHRPNRRAVGSGACRRGMWS